jgi:non-ribosomal peptide synthetase component F
VLAPLDLDLKVVWNQNELKDGKFHVAVKLFTDHVNIELNEEHYQQLFTLFHLPDIYYRKIKVMC